MLFFLLFVNYLGALDYQNVDPFELTGSFSLNIVIATIALSASVVTCVFALLEMKNYNSHWMQISFGLTLSLGCIFLGFIGYEFLNRLSEDLANPIHAASSALYSLHGIHGLQVLSGAIWIVIMIAQSFKKGITMETAPKLYIAGLFWIFLGFVWLFIFVIVDQLGYL